jgi:hypothetical protein
MYTKQKKFFFLFSLAITFLLEHWNSCFFLLYTPSTYWVVAVPENCSRTVPVHFFSGTVFAICSLKQHYIKQHSAIGCNQLNHPI